MSASFSLGPPNPTLVELDNVSDPTYILHMKSASPLAVTRTSVGWNVTHRATGLVVLAADVLPVRAMARRAVRLLLAGTTAFTAPSPSSIAALPTVRNAVIRTLGAARRRQFAPTTVSFGGAA